jgi:DNA-binding transcriptional ArsR family regulator
MKQVSMCDKMMELIARRFRTLGEPYRLRLIQQLEKGERSVGELVQALDGNQSNVSKHLQVLYDAGLVSRRRDGTSVLYAIGDPMVLKLCELVCKSEVEKYVLDSKGSFDMDGIGSVGDDMPRGELVKEIRALAGEVRELKGMLAARE